MSTVISRLQRCWTRVVRLIRGVRAWPISSALRGNLDIRRIGSKYGGGYVALGVLENGGVVYSVGVGEDVSFDEELLRLRPVRVFDMDPTPRSNAYIESRMDLASQYQFVPMGSAEASGVRRFFLRKRRLSCP